MDHDVFISHASEDKDAIARPLADRLQKLGAKVWFDEFTLDVGDSLSRSIDRGLSASSFGVVILSKAFLGKGWPDYELRGLISREVGGKKVILPIWHDITRTDVQKFSPWLADKKALSTAEQNLPQIALGLLKVIRPDLFKNVSRFLLWQHMKADAVPELTPLEDLTRRTPRYALHLMGLSVFPPALCLS